MIQKGIVESIISLYKYKVRIPKYDKLSTTPGAVATDDLASAIVCSSPGTKIAYVEGDIVLVGFENNEFSKPVILGLLYREQEIDSSQINIPDVNNTLVKLEKNLNLLNSNNLYTHIKYSNDNGTTFTSLYNYADTFFISTSQTLYLAGENISIDPDSSVIYWSVIDSNNKDVTSQITIFTTIYSDDDSSIREVFTESLINIPIKFKGLKNLKLSYRILYTDEFSNYHIVLTTDKNSIGSVYGDYIGICISSNPNSPAYPSNYAWMSSYTSTKYLIDKLEDELLKRLEQVEKSLFGFTYSGESLESDGTGLLDGITVSEGTVDIHGLDNKDINFNNNKSMFIDNKNNRFILNTLNYTDTDAEKAFSEYYTINGHLTLIHQANV